MGELDEEFGYYGGIGFGGRRFFVEARYRDVQATVSGLADLSFDEIDFDTGELEVDLTGWEFIIGIKF